jgi:hypothetical protein
MTKSQKLFPWRQIATMSAIASMLYGCTSSNFDGYRGVASGGGQKSAYEVWGSLQEGATMFNANALFVGKGQTVGDFPVGVTFGGEKEASSGLIYRIMGPNSASFNQLVNNMPAEQKEIFLRDFLSNYVKDVNGYRTFLTEEGDRVDLAKDVKDVDGVSKIIDMDQLKNVDYETANLQELESKFQKFLNMTEDRPMSFIKPSIRIKMFKGTLASLNSNKIKPRSWGDLVPNFGKAQKYIQDIHGQRYGWEIGFTPQHSYAEFEEMVAWFKKELKNAGKLFQAPGHQRMVFATHPKLKKKKLAELYKAIQAFIVLRGIQGKTGIESASYKLVHSDKELATLKTQRGVIRLEGDRWTSSGSQWGSSTNGDSQGIEFRAGTKDIRTARSYQTSLAARVSTNDFSGLKNVGDWELVPNLGYDDAYSADDIKKRFGVTAEEAKKALEVLKHTKINKGYYVPFWGWDHSKNPILSKPKRELVKSMVKDFILQVAALEKNDDTKKKVKNLMRQWVASTRLADEVENYMKPKRPYTLAKKLLNFKAPAGTRLKANPVDVNKIDLGIEYSGKMPVRIHAQYGRERLEDNRKPWIQTFTDLAPEEREAFIRNVAKDLSKNLGGDGTVTKVESGGGHGHGLELSYSLRDPQDRKWIVEWDGIGRNYNSAGEVIDESVRAGSIELVTPKFTPTIKDIQNVYKAFKSNNIMPNIMSGGGHINIDLAAFEGKPKELARFISIFNEHRGAIALMFQHVNRAKTSEPVDISTNLANQLKNFEGSEDDLKKLLYNEQYFNTRFGRKSRYVQLDLSAYFQDVIPEEFITEDFDISNPQVKWRRNFRVDPRIRKAEFRLFNAPRDSAESALQIRLAKAMLSKALNEEDTLSGKASPMKHLDYLANPQAAYDDLDKMCAALGLNATDYRPAIAEGLSETDLATRSIFFETLEDKLVMNPKQPGWGDAVTPRETAISSDGRVWAAGPADELNTITQEARINAAAKAEAMRANLILERESQTDFRRSNTCIDALGPLL